MKVNGSCNAMCMRKNRTHHQSPICVHCFCWLLVWPEGKSASRVMFSLNCSSGWSGVDSAIVDKGWLCSASCMDATHGCMGLGKTGTMNVPVSVTPGRVYFPTAQTRFPHIRQHPSTCRFISTFRTAGEQPAVKQNSWKLTIHSWIHGKTFQR